MLKYILIFADHLRRAAGFILHSCLSAIAAFASNKIALFCSDI
ncbi:hypothetical protein NIES2104_64980 [Leptolyngbya sp. NIES-2104]|nr:hypothetical protein NIES2104_64980 [Leptolyngbya sp. NIES-2104]